MTTINFYQSGDVIYTAVNLEDADHRSLVKLLLLEQRGSEANKLMKKIGLQPQKNDRGGNVWSSDLWLWHSEYKHNESAYKDELLALLS